MKSRLSLLLCAALLAGCLDSMAPRDDAAPEKAAPVVKSSPKMLCADTAARLERGRWDYTQRLYKSVKGVASDESVTLPTDFESFMKPYIVKDLVITADMRAKLVSQFKLWSAK